MVGTKESRACTRVLPQWDWRVPCSVVALGGLEARLGVGTQDRAHLHFALRQNNQQGPVGVGARAGVTRDGTSPEHLKTETGGILVLSGLGEGSSEQTRMRGTVQT